MSYRRIAQLRTVNDFQQHIASLGIDLPFDDQVFAGSDSPLAQSYLIHGKTIGNRFAILPMEGWDGDANGQPTALVKRRWQHFGASGAKLIWGGEAVAVRHDGRANPLQLLLTPDTAAGIAELRQTVIQTHNSHFGTADDLMVGLQLTHSGRFSRPNSKQLEPRILYPHPILNKKFHLPENYSLLTDAEIADLIGDFVRAAVLAQQIGFDFVDIKHCHGYLGHEFLSAVDRPGHYGGSFENRTRFLREIVAGIRRDAPGLHVGVRLSAFDWMPFRPGEDVTGVPETWSNGAYPYAFGSDATGLGIDLSEPKAFLNLLQTLDIRLVCLTAGSPYYNPHIQRPALFPPSDGYQPPEDPLMGVARQIHVTAQLKAAFPDLLMVGTGYSYLQDWLPNVAQAVVRTGKSDFVGLGRMVLSYPELPAHILAGKPLQRKRICRTFSDCTTAPRNGLVSGCYPLDDFYKTRPEAETLVNIKRQMKQPISSLEDEA